MKIYAISGLGADQRVFKFLQLDHELIPINWIIPLKNEPIQSYALRLAKSIDLEEEFALLGVSFGGLIAVELSKILNPKITILISSIETKNELNPMFRWFGNTRINKLFPVSFFNPPRWIAYYLFGTNKKQLLNSILNDTDLNFAKWAVNELLNWKNEDSLANVVKISGSNDKILPPPKNSEIILISGGEHFMIVDRADEISEIINSINF